MGLLLVKSKMHHHPAKPLDRRKPILCNPSPECGIRDNSRRLYFCLTIPEWIIPKPLSKPPFTFAIMKKILATLLTCLAAIFCIHAQNTFPSTGSVGIGTTAPLSSATLEVKSSTKGVLIPRMTLVQRSNIPSPALGLLVFQTDGTAGLYIYIAGWRLVPTDLSGYARWDLSNLSATTYINSTLLPAYATSINLGSGSRKWRNGYFTDSIYTRTLIASDSTDAGVRTYGQTYGLYAKGNNYGAYALGNYTGVYAYGNSYGVYANATNTGIRGFGESYGVYGGAYATGVYGGSINYDGFGVHGYNYSGTGVKGESGTSYGGVFVSTTGHGLLAKTSSTSPGVYAAVFEGSTYSYGAYITSDERVKKNIRSLESAMSLINKLHPKTYEFIHEGQYKNLNLPSGNHYGFLAQDLEKVFPELIGEAPLEIQDAPSSNPGTHTHQTAAGRNRSVAGTSDTLVANPPLAQKVKTTLVKAINYAELIPVMIQGIQELQREKDEEIAALKNQIADLQEMVKSLARKVDGGASNDPVNGALEQNQPNPFKDETIIPIRVPSRARSAQLTIIQTGSGKLVKTLNLQPGATKVSISAGSLAAGTYTYTLIIDSRQISSRQMVIL